MNSEDANDEKEEEKEQDQEEEEDEEEDVEAVLAAKFPDFKRSVRILEELKKKFP